MTYYYPQQSSIYNGGMSYGIPSNPIGNIAPIGYGGYNGGYYSGNYNTFNPYYIQQQKELQLAQQREVQRNESTIFKKLHTASAIYSGKEVCEDDLKKYDPVYDEDLTKNLSYEEKEKFYQKQRKEQYLNYHQQIILSMQGNSVPCVSTLGVAYANAYYEMNQRAKKEIPNDVGLAEYLEKYAPKKYVEALELDQKRQQADLTKMYNKADYNKLIGMHKTSLFGNVFDPNASIDDQEIRLPNLISESTRQERRKQFLNAIMKGG